MTRFRGRLLQDDRPILDPAEGEYEFIHDRAAGTGQHVGYVRFPAHLAGVAQRLSLTAARGLRLDIEGGPSLRVDVGNCRGDTAGDWRVELKSNGPPLRADP